MWYFVYYNIRNDTYIYENDTNEKIVKDETMSEFRNGV